MKLADLSANLTTTYELEHEIHGPTGWIMTLAGDGHPETKAALRKMLDTRARRKKSTAEQTEEDSNALLVARTLGWTGLDDLEYSPAAALQVYQDPTLAWVKEQIMKALGDDALFFKK